jgi:alanine racemase
MPSKSPLVNLSPRRRAWVEVDLDALMFNVHQIRQLLKPKTELLAVVKADAYGHGAVSVASALLSAGAASLGVATIPEAIQLRQSGVGEPILLLGAFYSAEEAEAIARWRIEPTLSSPKQALILSEVLADQHQPLPVHLNLDTGMARLGAPWQEVVEFARLVRSLQGLAITSLYSHLATADDPDPTGMKLQQQRFESAVGKLKQCGLCPSKLHLANSAATLANASFHYDLVRVGLALYGLYPAPHLRDRVQLKPALQVKARITHIKQLESGMGVSYGHRHVTTGPTPIAVVGIGYADGVPRSLSNRMQVIARGQLLPQIGSITMDQLMIDISNLPDLEPGEPVTVLGQDGASQISADDWAERLGTISWEILCGFKHRLPRVTISSDELAEASLCSFR